MLKTKKNIRYTPDWFKSSSNLKLSGVEIKFYLIFLLIILVGFWPVSTGIFSLKNDEIIYFLPYRYNIVENLRNGHLPLWSPYVYMGFPISGDMQSGAWNPLLWLLALTGRYTLTTLHAELLIYIYFATVGMFKLMRTVGFGTLVCFTIAISYTFSGFIVDSGQFICWISCACFLPYTYIYFIRLLGRPCKITSAKFAIANCCLLVVAGYPFFFIANIYFFAIAFLLYFINAWRARQKEKAIKVFKYLSLSVLLFVLLCAAPLLCFINLLPYYSRGTNMPLSAALFNSYSLFSSISFLFPFSVTRENINFGNNNILSRNLYIGLILLPFVVKGFFGKRRQAWNVILVFIIASFALSLGETLPFRRWAYLYLPLMNTFRHPSNFRLFITVGLLTLAARGLQEFLSSPKENRLFFLRSFYFMLFGIILLGVYFLPLKEANPFLNMNLTSVGLKKLVSILSFKQGVLLSLLVQVPFLIAAIVLFRNERYKLLCMLSILNMIFLAQPQLLSSTVAKNSVSSINRFLKIQPKGFPLPQDEPVSFAEENKIFIYEYKEPIEYFFNKKIAVSTYINNPTILKTYSEFINDSSLMGSLKDAPFLFLANSFDQINKSANNNLKKPIWLPLNRIGNKHLKDRVSLISFNPNEFNLSVKTDSSNSLVILQNNFPGWVATINESVVSIETVNDTFMGIKLPPGSYILKIQYKPTWFMPGIIISVAGLLLTLVLVSGKENFGSF